MTPVIFVLARTLHFGSALLLVALPIFRLFIMAPSSGSDGAAKQGSFSLKLIRWLWVALLLEAVSGVVWFWLVTAQMNDESPWEVLDVADFKTVLGQTQFGQLWLGRGVLGVVVGLVLFFVGRRKMPLFSEQSVWNWVVLVLSAGLLASLAWAGHAAAGIHHQGLHLVADTLHLLVGAVWPMGLFPLALFLLQHDASSLPWPPGQAIKTVRRFSDVALGAVVLILVTGIINSWLMVGSWGALVTTRYGWLLFGKVAVVVIMIGLGGYNRIYLVPSLDDAPGRFYSIRKTVMAESMLILVVLLMVGVLGMTSPPM